MRRLGLAPVATPTVGKAFDHFLIHTGGQAALDAMESCLGLSPAQVRTAIPKNGLGRARHPLQI